jgi:hypothetical protein
MYVLSAEILVEMKRPNAAIRDANKSIELNPGSSALLSFILSLTVYLSSVYNASGFGLGSSRGWDTGDGKLWFVFGFEVRVRIRARALR